jgi:hypothetical protein
MTNGEKTAVKLSFTENCTNSDFLNEPGNHILKIYGSGGIFFKTSPLGWYCSR